MNVLAPAQASFIVWAIIAIIVGIGRLIGKVAEDVKTVAPKAPTQRGLAHETPSHRGDSEEERTRKFLEALGLPPETLAPQSEPIRSAREAVRRASGVPPVPPFIPEQMRGTRESMSHQPPAAAPPARLEIEQRRREKPLRKTQPNLRPPKLPSAAAPYAGEIERVHFAELQTPETPAFRTRSSDVSAIPFEMADMEAAQLYIKEGTPRQIELLALARSPKALRQAVLMREILGPPRSLPTGWTPSSFASL